jgi:GDPmannose 4,6-dehydratase
MLQQSNPDDYVIATGETRTIREFCRSAFNVVGLDWSEYVITRSDLTRPTEVNPSRGDSTKARSVLGWEPTISFNEMVAEMVEADLRRHSAKSMF